MEQSNWSENIIIVDADYVDQVAFNLIVNFERMLERRIPQADLAKWLVCVALDGGMRPPQASGNEEQASSTHVILIHEKANMALRNFTPGHFKNELNAKAFNDQLGEFSISAVPVEPITTKEELLTETLQFVCSQKDVKRVMVVPDAGQYGSVKRVLDQIGSDEKRITVFAMEPMPSGRWHRQEILGYSLMAALGIRGEELSTANNEL